MNGYKEIVRAFCVSDAIILAKAEMIKEGLSHDVSIIKCFGLTGWHEVDGDAK